MTAPTDASRRRRIAVVVTLAVGATLLGASLALHQGNLAFYGLTAGLAATWVIGSFASGPLHLGRSAGQPSGRRPVITPILLGLAASAMFVLGALVVREIEPLRNYTDTVLTHARRGSLPVIFVLTLLNGVAEEVFFRGALFAAISRRHAVAGSTLVYTVATLATGNPMLAFAAATLGVVLGWQRRATGGVLAPILTHVTWSTVMLLALPPLFAN
ncbi:MAG: type II CAAX endopeptidase family protein [Jatrophihabitantaceae bacterium]